jgi:hypothetical protein
MFTHVLLNLKMHSNHFEKNQIISLIDAKATTEKTGNDHRKIVQFAIH